MIQHSEDGNTRTPVRAWPHARLSIGIDNLTVAWTLLLIGSLSFTDASAAVALSGQLNFANLLRYACVLMALASLAPELRFPVRVRLDPLWLFASYAAICVVSTAWSISPVVTLGKAVELSAAVATVVFAARRPVPGRALGQLLNVTFVFGAALLAAAAFGYFLGLPGFWAQTRGLISAQLDTWFLSGNGVGYASALTATLALDRFFKNSQRRWVMAALYLFALMTAILAQGRTGLLAFALGSFLVLAIRRRFKWLLTAGALLMIAVILFGDVIQAYLVRGEAIENLQTLSGRSVMWEAAWQSFLDHPLLGRGYGVGGRSLFLDALSGFGVEVSSLHSGFLELLTGVGLLGFVPWIASLVWTTMNAIRSGRAAKNVSTSALMLPLLAMTVMSTGAGGWLDLPLAYFLCVTAILGHASAARLRRPAPGIGSV